jgi:hypothetical protein
MAGRDCEAANTGGSEYNLCMVHNKRCLRDARMMTEPLLEAGARRE